MKQRFAAHWRTLLRSKSTATTESVSPASSSGRPPSWASQGSAAPGRIFEEAGFSGRHAGNSRGWTGQSGAVPAGARLFLATAGGAAIGYSANGLLNLAHSKLHDAWDMKQLWSHLQQQTGSMLQGARSIPEWTVSHAEELVANHVDRYIPLGPNFLADAAAKAIPAVVNITGGGVGVPERGCGSGFIFDAEGLIMTNAHVVEEALLARPGDARPPSLMVTLQDGRTFQGELVSSDRASDLALVRVRAGAPLPAARLGRSERMRIGEWVLALGSPLHLQNSLTAGIVSCVHRRSADLGLKRGGTDYIQTDASLARGSSGGPLVNLAGEVVGISCMKAMLTEGVSFAIPIDTAREVMAQLATSGRVVRPYIGVKLLQLDASNSAQLRERSPGFPAVSEGIMVPHVIADSPAARAGLLPGDVIIGFADKGEPATWAALIKALEQHIGQPMRLSVRRPGCKEALQLEIIATEAVC